MDCFSNRSDPDVCLSKPVCVSSPPASKRPSGHSFWAAGAENHTDQLGAASLMDRQTSDSNQKSRANRARHGLMAGPVTKTFLVIFYCLSSSCTLTLWHSACLHISILLFHSLVFFFRFQMAKDRIKGFQKKKRTTGRIMPNQCGLASIIKAALPMGPLGSSQGEIRS